MRIFIENSSPHLQKCVSYYAKKMTPESEIASAFCVDNDIEPSVGLELHPEGDQVCVNGVKVSVTYADSSHHRWRTHITRPIRVTLCADSMETIQEFCKNAVNLYENVINSVPNPHGYIDVLRLDYCWEKSSCVKKRDIDTVYLPKGVLQNVLHDVTAFLSPEVIARYTQLCIAHSRVYMFHGLPGTGKSTLIKAVASHFDKRIATITIDRELNDVQLRRAFRKLPANAFLVIEDVDCLFDSRDNKNTGVSFSSFLNALDGVESSNFIVFMTTNRLNVLDSALTRRVDYFLEFDYAKKDQIRTMFEAYYPSYIGKFDQWYTLVRDVPLTTNILQKFFTKHLFHDITALVDEFKHFATSEISIKTVKSMYV